MQKVTLWLVFWVGIVLLLLVGLGDALVFKNKKSKATETKTEKKTTKMGKQALIDGDYPRALRTLEAHLAADSAHATAETLWLTGRALKELHRYRYTSHEEANSLALNSLSLTHATLTHSLSQK